MKSAQVVIKSFTNGISVYLDPKPDFENILELVEKRFKESAGFFGDARMALSFEGRKLNEIEETRLIERIGQSCSLRIVCLVGHDDVKNQTYLRAVQKVEDLLGEGLTPPEAREKKDSNKEYTGVLHKKNSEFLRFSVKEHQRIEVPGNIVVLGDISGGSSVIAGGDIIVMGGLYGEAHAGGDKKEGHFIAALELSPEGISIGDVEVTDQDLLGKWPIKSRPLPRMAYVKDGRILMDVVDRELWKEVLDNA